MTDISLAINSLLTALALGARAASGIASDSSPAPSFSSSSSSAPPASSASPAASQLSQNDFTFLNSFPEYQHLTTAARGRVQTILRETLSSLSSSSVVGLPSDDSSWGADADADAEEDPELWEACADACESLLDRVNDVLEGGGARALGGREALVAASSLARVKAASSRQGFLFARGDDGKVDKSQKTYSFAMQVDNGRTAPFVPRVSPLKPHGITPLYLVPVSGHGLSSARSAAPSSLAGGGDGGDGGDDDDDGDLVAPKLHYPHPYMHEINALVFQPWQLERPKEGPRGGRGHNGTLRPAGTADVDGKTGLLKVEGCVFIDNDQDLAVLSERLGRPDVREIAVDLEAHSFRSFSGFTCLMQISVRQNTVSAPTTAPTASSSTAAAAASSSLRKSSSQIMSSTDFLIDTLSLRRSLPQLLSPVFADPGVVKVMHGADSDVLWLQRDFGIYVVNLFDTGRAARSLRLPSFGLKHLERQYAGYEADKRYQMADWRVRPLTEEMMSYARSDTHFLIDIYDEMRRDLHDMGGEAAVVAVLEDSRQLCLRRFEREPFRISGWKSLLGPSSSLSDKQTYCIAKLWDWRDATAREQDESLEYVCPGAALRRIATIMPTKVDGLAQVVNPLPPLVLANAETIIAIVEEASKRGGAKKTAATTSASATTDAEPQTSSKLPPPPPALKVAPDGGAVSQLRANASSFSFKPTAAPNLNQQQQLQQQNPPIGRHTGMSPVLGAEALYRQAGWLTPTPPAFRSSPPSATVGAGAANPYGQSDSKSRGVVGAIRPVAEDDDDDDDYMEDDDVEAGAHKARGTAVVPVKVVPATSNRGYVTSRYNKDSVELGGGVDGCGIEIDGLGAKTRAAAEASSGASRDDAVGAGFRPSGDGKNNPLSSSAADPSAPSRGSIVAQRAADAIKNDLSKKGTVLLSLADGSAFSPPSVVSAAPESASGSAPAGTSSSPPPNAAIPKSMSEIYQISNWNRRRNKEKKKNEEADGDADGDSVGESTDHQDLNLSNSSSIHRHKDLLNDSTTSSVDNGDGSDLDVDNILKAEELLSRSGGAGGYFASRSKRQKSSEHSVDAMNAAAGGSASGAAGAAKRGNDSEVFKLITGIGWVESEREAAELYRMMNESTSGTGAEEEESQNSLDTSRSFSSADNILDSGMASGGARPSRRSRKTGKATKQQQHQMQMQMQHEGSRPAAFDYASANVVGAHGVGGLSSNPFFANAANEPRQQEKRPPARPPGMPGMPQNSNANNLIVEKMPKSGDRSVTIRR